MMLFYCLTLRNELMTKESELPSFELKKRIIRTIKYLDEAIDHVKADTTDTTDPNYLRRINNLTYQRTQLQHKLNQMNAICIIYDQCMCDLNECIRDLYMLRM